MSCTELYIATKALTTIGTEVRVKIAPESGPMPTYTVTVANPVSFTINAAATAQGANFLEVSPATTVPLPAGTELTFASATVVVREYTKAGKTQIPINPASAAIAAAETADFTPEANDVGDSLLFVAPTSTYIDAGDILDFGGTKVVVTAGQPAGSQLFPCVPLAAAVLAGATATTKGLLLLVGCNDATPGNAPKVVDRTRYVSGAGQESQTVGSNRTINVSYMLMDDPEFPDLGAESIELVLNDDAYLTRNLYALVRRANGETYEGLTICTQSNPQAPVQDRIMNTVSMQFQGCSFSRVPGEGNSLALPAFAGAI